MANVFPVFFELFLINELFIEFIFSIGYLKMFFFFFLIC